MGTLRSATASSCACATPLAVRRAPRSCPADSACRMKIACMAASHSRIQSSRGFVLEVSLTVRFRDVESVRRIEALAAKLLGSTVFGVLSPRAKVPGSIELYDAAALAVLRAEGLVRHEPRHGSGEHHHPVGEYLELIGVFVSKTRPKDGDHHHGTSRPNRRSHMRLPDTSAHARSKSRFPVQASPGRRSRTVRLYRDG